MVLAASAARNPARYRVRRRSRAEADRQRGCAPKREMLSDRPADQVRNKFCKFPRAAVDRLQKDRMQVGGP